MDSVQILCKLRDVSSFLDVFPSDLLPQSVAQLLLPSSTMPIPTQRRSHWLAVHFRPKASIAYLFGSYGIVSLVPFMKRNCTTWDSNRRQLQGLTTHVGGKYCSLIAHYMHRGYTPKQFISLFDACNNAVDRQVEWLFTTEFRAQMSRGIWGQCCRSCL